MIQKIGVYAFARRSNVFDLFHLIDLQHNCKHPLCKHRSYKIKKKDFSELIIKFCDYSGISLSIKKQHSMYWQFLNFHSTLLVMLPIRNATSWAHSLHKIFPFNKVFPFRCESFYMCLHLCLCQYLGEVQHSMMLRSQSWISTQGYS